MEEKGRWKSVRLRGQVKENEGIERRSPARRELLPVMLLIRIRGAPIIKRGGYN